MSKLAEIRRRGGWAALPALLGRSALRYAARRLRVRYLRVVHGMDIAPDVFVGPGIKFVNPRRIEIATGASVAAGVSLWSETDTGRLRIGRNSQVNRLAEVDFSADVTIGANCIVSAEVLIMTHDHGRDPFSDPKFSPLIVGDGAWIGARAIVLPKVNYIGQGAVVGAGAVVTCDVPDGATFVSARGRLRDPNA
jgi:acetyltransferase-like isoleucine patch superfamily enzyme